MSRFIKPALNHRKTRKFIASILCFSFTFTNTLAYGNIAYKNGSTIPNYFSLAASFPQNRPEQLLVFARKAGLIAASGNLTLTAPTSQRIETAIEKENKSVRSELRLPPVAAGSEAEPPEGKKGDGDLLPVLIDYSDRLKALAKRLREGEITLPQDLDENVVSAAVTTPDQLVGLIMRDQKLVDKLIETGVWGDKEQLRRALNLVAFGSPSEDTVMAVRQFAATVQSGLKETRVTLAVANLLMDHRLDAPKFMAIADELLRKQDPALAENLESLLKENPAIQMRAFKWLFDQLIREAERAISDKPNEARHLLTVSIILKQFNRVLSNTDEDKWLGLQIHMIMRFAERIAEESKGHEKPFMRALMIFFSELSGASYDFLLAIDTNFGKVALMDEAKKTESLLMSYGGFDNYAQAIETMLSFAVSAWPDKFFPYFESRYPHGTKTMQAQYLNSMKYGIHRRDSNGSAIGFHKNRLAFILDHAVSLSNQKSAFIQSRLDQTMDFIPNEFIDYLLDDGCYQRLGEDSRLFLIEFILRSAISGVIPNGRRKVFPMIQFELKKEENYAIKGKILFGNYFSEDFLGVLEADDARLLRSAILDGFHVFNKSDVLEKNLIRIMKFFGLSAIDEAFKFYDQRITTKYDRAIGALLLASHVASVLDVSNDKESLTKLARFLGKVAKLAKDESTSKQDDAANFYELREKVARWYSELEGLETQRKTVTSASKSINEKVEELDEELGKMMREQGKLKDKKNEIAASIQAAYVYQKEISDKLKQFWLVQRAFGAVFASYARHKARKKLEKLKEQEGRVAKTDQKSESILAGHLGDNPTLRQLQLAMKASEANVYGLEAESASISSELAGIATRLKQMEPEREKALKDQADMTEAFSRLNTRQEELERKKKNAEETTLPLFLDMFKSSSRKASDYHAALRLFLKSPSFTADIAGQVYERLRIKTEEKESPDGGILVTLLGMVLEPRYQGVGDLEGLKAELAKYLRHQAEHGLFKDEVAEEIRFLVERTKAGQLVPQSPEDVIYETFRELLQKKLLQPDATQQVTKLASQIEHARLEHKRVTKRVVREIISFAGAANANLGGPVYDFLQLKFGPQSETAKLLCRVFVIIVMHAETIEEAIESFLSLISGEEGMFFVKPEEEKIEKPKNRAEQIEKRYRDYYESLHALRDITYKNQQEIFRLTEGLGWEKEANNLSSHYFSFLFNLDAASEPLRNAAEMALWYLIILPWLEEGLVSDKPVDKPAKRGASQKDEAKLQLDDFSVLSNIEAYISQAPKITQADATKPYGNRKVARHDAKFLVDLAYLFSKKIETSGKRFEETQLKSILRIFERLESIIAPDVVFDDHGKPVNVLQMIRDVGASVKSKLRIAQARPERELPSRPDRFALPKAPPPHISRQLPGDSERGNGSKRSELRFVVTLNSIEVNPKLLSETEAATIENEIKQAIASKETKADLMNSKVKFIRTEAGEHPLILERVPSAWTNPQQITFKFQVLATNQVLPPQSVKIVTTEEAALVGKLDVVKTIPGEILTQLHDLIIQTVQSKPTVSEGELRALVRRVVGVTDADANTKVGLGISNLTITDANSTENMGQALYFIAHYSGMPVGVLTPEVISEKIVHAANEMLSDEEDISTANDWGHLRTELKARGANYFSAIISGEESGNTASLLLDQYQFNSVTTANGIPSILQAAGLSANLETAFRSELRLAEAA